MFELRNQCCKETCFIIDEKQESGSMRKYDPTLLLAFHTGLIWTAIEEIFYIGEKCEVKGRK